MDGHILVTAFMFSFKIFSCQIDTWAKNRTPTATSSSTVTTLVSHGAQGVISSRSLVITAPRLPVRVCLSEGK